MLSRLSKISATGLLVASFAFAMDSAKADAPQVIADISPVHGLVTAVMGDLGAPTLLFNAGLPPVEGEASQSKMTMLGNSDLVFWIGPSLTPSLEKPVEELPDTVTTYNLLDSEGVGLRDRAEPHSLQLGHGQTVLDSSSTSADDTRVDPYAWLDPDNAIIWLDTIADALSEADPENASTYRSNAVAAATAINIEVGRITQTVLERDPMPVLVYHNSYSYFLSRFELPLVLAIAESEAMPPSTERLTALREDIAGLGVQCVFSEPNSPEEIVATLADETGLERRTLDPLGSAIEPGADYYPALLRSMAEAFSSCG